MSTLKVTEIQSLSASTPPLFEDSSGAEMGRLCRAFVNFNGTGTVSTNQTIRASFNVSSVFKNATGVYTVHFTNAMPDANYAIIGTDGQNGSNDGSVHLIAAQTSSSVSIETGKVFGSLPADRIYVNVAIFR
jgi:hypothetical protein